MKKLLIISVLTIALFSCKKDKTPSASGQTNELQSKVSFTVGDSTYTVNGSLADSAYSGSIFTKNNPGLGNNSSAVELQYYLRVETPNLELGLDIPTNTLTTTTYSLTNTGIYVGLIPAGLYTIPSLVGISGNGVYSSIVTIQSIHDGAYADGIFSATANVQNGDYYVNITNGTFKNVKILY